MKKVLIITYYWPPTGGSGVQRWVKFTKYLRRFGWEPVIYTPENPEQLAMDESLLTDIPSGITVLKSHISEPYALYRKFFGGSSAKGAGVNPLNQQKKSFKQQLAVFLRGNLFFPDPRAGWVKPSVSFLSKYLNDNPVDAVVTTGPPHSMHLIGLELHRKTGVRWIADFRDPWTEMHYFKHMGLLPWVAARHRRVEQEVLDEADVVIAVSAPVREDFQARTKTPVVLITNGYDEDDFASEPAELPADRFTIVHTGLFASDGNPLVLWDVLARKCASDSNFKAQLRICLAGKTDPEVLEAIALRGLSENLENLGYLPHWQSVRLQRSANVLILPLRQEPEYKKALPGKIFEYLAARRPVLGIGQENGAAAGVLKDSGAGVMYDWERVEPVRNYIESAWERHLLGTDKAPEGDIRKYSRIALTEQLTKIL
ncbi:MAG: glycosyltransferase family 4 protein [Bacteroidales bacterium]|nr:glycosyltransferase family 4 protein [Bacteroidales bacterium]